MNAIKLIPEFLEAINKFKHSLNGFDKTDIAFYAALCRVEDRAKEIIEYHENQNTKDKKQIQSNETKQ